MLQVTPYASDELVLIVPRHHDLAKQGSIALEELYTLPLVSLNQVPLLILFPLPSSGRRLLCLYRLMLASPNVQEWLVYRLKNVNLQLSV